MGAGVSGMEDSRDLVRNASRGDREAVETLLERHLPALRRYVDRRAGRVVLERETRSDVVQSVCRELFDGLRAERFEYRGELEFKHWLYGAVLLKLSLRRRRWRAEMRDVTRESAIGADESRAAEACEPIDSRTPSVEAIRCEDLARLRAALAELPEHYREIIELAHVDGLSHKEIGERLGIRETNSRVLLTRALARLAAIGAGQRP
jgi:RNA polymerase sigma-70 factor, ECF subfamily